jgi:hypothetical protein
LDVGDAPSADSFCGTISSFPSAFPRDPDFIRLIFIFRLLSEEADDPVSVRTAVALPPADGTFNVAPTCRVDVVKTVSLGRRWRCEIS